MIRGEPGGGGAVRRGDILVAFIKGRADRLGPPWLKSQWISAGMVFLHPMKSFLQLAIACVLIMHARAADGWEKVKWGMTATDVREIYPMALRPDLPADQQDDLQPVDFVLSPSSTLEISEYEWQGLKFTVTFTFDQKSKGLIGCLLKSVHDRGIKDLNLRPHYERVVKEISKVHGKPIEEGMWISETTYIRCSLIFANDPERTSIVLGYSFEPDRVRKMK